MTQRNKEYKTKEWKLIRSRVLALDHYQCTECGRIFSKQQTYTQKASDRPLVHHRFEVDKYPEYKYDIYVNIGGKQYRNLVTLCFSCHELKHGRKGKIRETEIFGNEERFD